MLIRFSGLFTTHSCKIWFIDKKVIDKSDINVYVMLCSRLLILCSSKLNTWNNAFSGTHKYATEWGMQLNPWSASHSPCCAKFIVNKSFCHSRQTKFYQCVFPYISSSCNASKPHQASRQYGSLKWIILWQFPPCSQINLSIELHFLHCVMFYLGNVWISKSAINLLCILMYYIFMSETICNTKAV